MSATTYALVCVAAPAGWGVLMYVVFGFVDRRRGARRLEKPSQPPTDYSI